MKRESIAWRLAVILLASSAVTNCGQNNHNPRNNGETVSALRMAHTQITGNDASRNTKTVTREATTDECAGGGKVDIRFDDTSGNGQLDRGELIRSATIHCHGANGQKPYSIVSREFDPDRNTCPQGGVGFIQFIDQARDGNYDPSKGDKLIGTPATRCQPGSIAITSRPATLADCPLSGGKGDVIQYYFDSNHDGKFSKDQGDSLAAEIPACATPKNIAAVQAVTSSTVSQGNSCALYTFTPPAAANSAIPPQSFSIQSCNSPYGAGFLETPPDAKTCPNGGVMLALYLDEDHNGLIDTASERASVVDPLPLCFAGASANPAPIGASLATMVNHVSTLTNQCTQSGGAGTVFTNFLSQDGSGIYRSASVGSPADTVLSSFSVCDPADGKPVARAPLLLPEERLATADELKEGHCAGTSAVVTQSRLFGDLDALQSWLRNKVDENNQGRLMSDANIVCSASALLNPNTNPNNPAFAAAVAAAAQSSAASPTTSPADGNLTPVAPANLGANANAGAAANPNAAGTFFAPIRNTTAILPVQAAQCTDGSKWYVLSFKDHDGTAIYNASTDGVPGYGGCLNESLAAGQPEPEKAGTHSELRLTKIEANSTDYPLGGYTLSVYSKLARNQKAGTATQHVDYTVANGPAGPASAIAIRDLNSYIWADPRKAPKQACDGVAVVNFYDTAGNGTFNPGMPVLNEFALCQSQEVGLRIRASRATDRGCEANAGLVFETYLDREHAGRYVEGNPITQSVPYCPPPAVQAPVQNQTDCDLANATLEGEVTRLSSDELASPQIRENLPYTVDSSKLGLTTYGSHLVTPQGGTSYVKDSQVVYRVSFGLPPQEAIQDPRSISLSMNMTGVRTMGGPKGSPTDLFCLLDADKPECSGERFADARSKYLNPTFWRDLPDGRAEGKAMISNQEFSKRLSTETRLSGDDRSAYKYFSGLEISLGDMFPDVDQSRFLYTGAGKSGVREFLVEIADDTYASLLHFQAKMKLQVCRAAVPAQANALLAQATNGN